MNIFSHPRFLAIYSGVLTVVFAVTVLAGFQQHESRRVSFDEIDVHRINIVEPNGLLRMVISDKAEYPGSFIRGKEVPRPDRQATGMLFMDDEGTEMDGLIFGGEKSKDGKVESDGHLSFDRYNQDQIFTIDAGEEGGKHYSGLRIDDRSDVPISELFEVAGKIRALPKDQQQAAWERFESEHPGDANRIYLGRRPDKSAALRLKDTDGHDRVIIQVASDGSPSIQLLDAKGKLVGRLPQ